MEKKRILCCGEASFLSTGFSTYTDALLRRLHSTGKYEIAEFGCYASTSDSKRAGVPWKYYSNMPNSPEEEQVYHSKPTNEFGEWKFESVALNFKPDIVFDIRDFWMFEYQSRSPFRKYYKWVIMPTVDSAPQDDPWVSTFIDADSVLTYSDWALDVLKQQSQGAIKTFGSAPPGIDTQTYHLPLDKQEHRAKMGLERDVFIIGTMMRNQKRKLYPDLIEAFAGFLKVAPPEIASRSYLYMHCAFPDIGWDIPRLIKEAGVANRCFFTYFCQQCSGVFPSFYQDVVGTCPHCGSHQAIMPRTQVGISRERVVDILGLFDVYVQYSTCEGFGLPQVEAAACGVPVMAVDYSAMSDVVRKLNGWPIAVERYFRESETHTYKALPNNKDLIDKLKWFFSLPEEDRKKWGLKTRQAAQKHYNWDRTAKVWEACFDSLKCPPQSQTWFSPAKLYKPAESSPEGLSNEEFVRWAMVNIAHRPDLANSYLAMRLIRDLNWGVYQDIGDELYINDNSMKGSRNAFGKKFGRSEVAQLLFNMVDANNFWEKERTNGKRS